MTGRRRRNPNSWTRKFKTLFRKTKRLFMSTLAALWNILKLSLYISIPLLVLFFIFFSFVYLVENTEKISSVFLIKKVADFRMSQKNYDEAFGLWTRIHRINRKQFGSSHAKTINALYNLGTISFLQKRNDEALHFFMKVYEKRQTLLGDSHPQTMKALEQLVRVERKILRKQGLLPKHGSHPETSASLNETLGLESDADRNEKAGNIMIEKMFKQMLTSSKKVFGEFNPQATTYRNALALHLYEKGETDQALSLLRTTYEKHNSLYGATHPETLYILVGLVDILLKAGYIAEAERVTIENFDQQQQQQQQQEKQQQQEVVTARMKQLRVISLQSVGHTYFNEEKYAEAEKIYEKVYNFHLAFSGEDNKLTWESLADLLNAITLQKSFNKEKAVELYNIFLKGSQKTFLNFKGDADDISDEHANRLANLAGVSIALEDFETTLKISSQLYEILEKSTLDEPQKYKLMAFALNLITTAHVKLGHVKEMVETFKKLQQFQFEHEEEIPEDFPHEKPITR